MAWHPSIAVRLNTAYRHINFRNDDIRNVSSEMGRLEISSLVMSDLETKSFGRFGMALLGHRTMLHWRMLGAVCGSVDVVLM